MHSDVLALRNEYSGCTCDACKKAKCELRLGRFPSEKVILDVDCIAKQRPKRMAGERCDFIVVVEEGKSIFLIPIEFKAKRVIPEKVESQLESGIKFFKKHSNVQFKCRPVLVSQKLGRPNSKRLQKMKIEHNGEAVRIRHVRCNRTLSWKNARK